MNRQRIHMHARRLSPLRRGTALLMVIGILALLSVVAVAYVAIGRADRTTSATVISVQRIEDQSGSIADYLKSVIANDIFSLYVDGNPSGAQRAVIRRELSDAPETDRLMRSTLARAQSHNGQNRRTYLFSPHGSFTGLSGRSLNSDEQELRLPSDPWLASLEPVRYSVPAATALEWSLSAQMSGWGTGIAPVRGFADWGQISNFAPSGNFANLFNLRNNFDAEPGFGIGSDGLPRMSEFLTLMNPNGNGPWDSYAPTDVMMRWDTLSATDETATGGKFAPANWTRWQLRAFRVMADDLSPGDPGHIFNQWADADGDGYADSRWFELADISNQTDAFAGVTWLIPRDGRVRYFVAARAVDLTGLVNVNTATDLAYRPGYTPRTVVQSVYNYPGNHPLNQIASARFTPAGITPGDIDLRRLLSMSDVYFAYGRGYDEAVQPPAGFDTGDYRDYDYGSAGRAGYAAYAAIRSGIDYGLRFGVHDYVGGRTQNSAYLLPNNSEANPNPVNPNPVPGFAKANLYSAFGVETRSATSVAGSNARAARTPFGLESELELRTWNGVNNSASLSPLEETTGGRGGTGDLAYFDPLRSDRLTHTEMQDRFESGGNAGASNEALFLSFIDLRRLLTTVNGARPLVDREVIDTNGDGSIDGLDALTLTARELGTDAVAIKKSLAPIDQTTGKVRRVNRSVQGEVVAERDAVRALFFGYLNALAPFRDIRVYDDLFEARVHSNVPAKLTNPLNYGGLGLEFAIRVVAHMTANAKDMMDRDEVVNIAGQSYDMHAPTALEVSPITNPQAVTMGPNRLRFDDAEFKVSPTDTISTSDAEFSQVRSPRVMVYGIEPQPFLVEAMFFQLYTDAKDGAPNATIDEAPEPDDDPSTPDEIEPVTISRKRYGGNSDFLGEVLAFQLHNPFEDDIVLTRPNGAPVYYIEFAGQHFAVAELDRNALTFNGQGIVLKSGASMTFYAMSPRTPEQMAARINSAGQFNAGDDGYTDESDVVDMLQTQLGTETGSNAILTTMFNLTAFDGNSLPPAVDAYTTEDVNGTPSEFVDLINETGHSGTTPTGLQKKTIKLWRVNRPTGSTSPLDPGRDILMDRLRIPDENEDPTSRTGSPTSNGQNVTGGPSAATVANDWHDLVAGSELSDEEEITGSVSGPEGCDLCDNSGFSTMLWMSVRRPTRMLNSPAVQELGILPPWCIEAKAATNVWNRKSLNRRFGTTGDFADAGTFQNETGANFQTLEAMLAQLRSSPDDFNQEMPQEPWEKAGNPIEDSQSEVLRPDAQGRFGSSPSVVRTTYRDSAIHLRWIGEDRNLALFSRAGDFLLPLAIGPLFDPDPDMPGSDDAAKEDNAWLTLSEAAAIASDYYSPTPTGNPQSEQSMFRLYAGIGHTDESSNTAADHYKPVLRQGQLVIDDYAPFIDQNQDGVFDRPADESIGLGIPLALNILSEFRAADYVPYDPTVRQAPGSLTQVVPGLVNINTAPKSVLNLVPMLTPDPANNLWVVQEDAGANVAPSSNAAENPLPLYKPSASSADQRLSRYDVASTLDAMRHKIDSHTRPHVTAGGAGTVLEFGEESGEIGDPREWKARAERTGIQGLREEPNFRSPGEIGTAILRSPRAGTDPFIRLNGIDRFGHDAVALRERGLFSSLETYPNGAVPPSPGERTSDRIVDDHAESLAILTAAGNSITTRSDVFCVWFVVHGYAPEDVADLEPTDPMVPSVKRRFVMIVDRSNVTAAGQEPRVLMMRELPYE